MTSPYKKNNKEKHCERCTFFGISSHHKPCYKCSILYGDFSGATYNFVSHEDDLIRRRKNE